MKHYIFLPIALAVVTATLLFSSCTISLNKDAIEPGEMTKETRNLGAFNQIHVGGAMSIEFVTSDSSYIEIETGKNILPHIKTEVNDSILKIMPVPKEDKPFYSSNERTFHFQPTLDNCDIKVKIFAPSLKDIDLSGATNFKADNITNDNIVIQLSGATAADIKNLTCKNVKIDATGASKITIKVNGADNTEVEATGACKADITFNNCNRTGINVAGAASMKLKGTLNTLDKHIAGACSLDTNELKLTNNNNQK